LRSYEIKKKFCSPRDQKKPPILISIIFVKHQAPEYLCVVLIMTTIWKIRKMYIIYIYIWD